MTTDTTINGILIYILLVGIYIYVCIYCEMVFIRIKFVLLYMYLNKNYEEIKKKTYHNKTKNKNNFS